MLAQSWKYYQSNATLIVYLRHDLTWWNGSVTIPLTAWDVWANYVILWKAFDYWQPWLENITVINNYTLLFKFRYPFYSGIYAILNTQVGMPYFMLAKYAKEAYSTTNTTLLNEIANEVKEIPVPDDWSNGPYWMPPSSVGSEGAILVKNPYFFNASAVKFSIINFVWFTNNNIMTPQIEEGLMSYGVLTLPISILESLNTSGKVLVGLMPTLSATGIWFNWHYPFNISYVREAFAYLINTSQAASAFPPSYLGIQYQDGMTISPSSLPAFIRENMYNYTYNVTKGYQLLEKAGFKYYNGEWHYPNGTPFTITIDVSASFSDWVAIAEDEASQLTQEGIPTKVYEVATSTLYGTVIPEGEYTVVQNWVGGSTLGLAFNNFETYLGEAPPSFNASKLQPVVLANGTTIYVNVTQALLNLEEYPPYSKQWNISLAKLVWFWNYWIPSMAVAEKFEPMEFYLTAANWKQILGSPQFYIDGFPVWTNSYVDEMLFPDINGAEYEGPVIAVVTGLLHPLVTTTTSVMTTTTSVTTTTTTVKTTTTTSVTTAAKPSSISPVLIVGIIIIIVIIIAVVVIFLRRR
jgi:peptide/nickel transport system substrate-binding protein